MPTVEEQLPAVLVVVTIIAAVLGILWQAARWFSPSPRSQHISPQYARGRCSSSTFVVECHSLQRGPA